MMHSEFKSHAEVQRLRMCCSSAQLQIAARKSNLSSNEAAVTNTSFQVQLVMSYTSSEQLVKC
jgi:hypothetical protein